jgi:hypothetical protein
MEISLQFHRYVISAKPLWNLNCCCPQKEKIKRRNWLSNIESSFIVHEFSKFYFWL